MDVKIAVNAAAAAAKKGDGVVKAHSGNINKPSMSAMHDFPNQTTLRCQKFSFIFGGKPHYAFLYFFVTCCFDDMQSQCALLKSWKL